MTAKTCILIHGAWHGSWVWSSVIDSIKTNGEYKEIIAPDLPGHGNNKMDFKDITLAVYVDYIIDLVKLMSKPVVLVGHIMSGIIISQVAEQTPSDIACLIYLAGFVPDNYGSLVEEEKKAKYPSVSLATAIDQDNYLIKIDSQKLHNLFYNCCNVDHIHRVVDKTQDQPLLPFLSQVSLSQNKFGSVKKFYITCLQDNAIHPVDQERVYKKINCKILTLDTDHSPFFSATDKLAAIINSCIN